MLLSQLPKWGLREVHYFAGNRRDSGDLNGKSGWHAFGKNRKQMGKLGFFL